jgi:hypothetical protein
MAAKTVAPAFTRRRHYTAISDALADVRAGFDGGDACQFGVECAADALAALFAEDDPRFDNERFREACGIVGEVVAGMPDNYRETPIFGGAA